MEQSNNNNWMVDLDEASYSHLVELSQNLSKVEGLVKKLVKDYKPWAKICDFSQCSSNFASADNNPWGDWPNSSKTENEENNNQPEIHDWDSTNDGEASNDKNNDTTKCDWLKGWDDGWNTQPDWSNTTSKNEKSSNWDTPNVSEWDKGFWESGWEKSDSKESKQEQIDWEPVQKSGW